MRTPFVLVEASLADVGRGTRVPLDQDVRHHLGRVLRRGDGDPLELTDGRGHVVDAVLSGDVATCSGPVRRHAPPAPRVRVVHALPKGRALDEVVRTLTELGVAELVPVVTERCVSRLDGDRAAAATQRWQAVADASAQQARRAHRLRVDPVASLDRVVDELARTDGFLLVADPGASVALGAVLRAPDTLREDVSVSVVVGPEGGFTDRELSTLTEAGFTAVRAGGTVLRSIHAATVLATAVIALRGGYDEM